MGAHYTPPALAGFVADKIVERIGSPESRYLRVLDPACGNGQLLEAAIEAMLRIGVEHWDVTGIEADPQALSEAGSRLDHRDSKSVHLIAGDFLDLATAFQSQKQLWSNDSIEIGSRFDIVIANPPYVRTQVLGAAKAQQIASRFNLSGRVDLYHAFILAIADVLRTGGILGIITSNRFMTTLAGKVVRGFLGSQFELMEVIDLGDTKLFEAAVLPAVLIARRREDVGCAGPYPVSFTRVYSQQDSARESDRPPQGRGSIVEALATGDEGVVDVPEGTFAITRGRFSVAPGMTDVWSLVSAQESQLLARIHEKSDCTIGDVALVRVGIKTTADDVFIRDDWAELPSGQRPESEVLRPILRHEDAHRWAMPDHYVTATRVLYPHVVSGTGKKAIDLNQYPRARAYLEGFRSRLEARRYVIESGRRWYEIWVPQDPGAWKLPKVVFPDISPDSRFSFVEEEYVVNGDCYWMTLRPGVPDEVLYLILGVANSTLMASFHDVAFSNRLYSGRRRYITQYVSKYPLPPTGSVAARQIIGLVKELLEETAGQPVRARVSQLENDLDVAVHEAFGLAPDQVLR